jgi:hypothetical protein
MQNLVEEILKTEKGIFQIPTDIWGKNGKRKIKWNS